MTTRICLLVLLAATACTEPVDPRFLADESSAEGSDEDGECGTTTCQDGLRISFVAQGASFDPGQYEVRLTVDGEVRACGFRVAAEPDECGGEGPCLVEEDCDASFNFVVMPHTIGITVGPVPRTVDVSVERDRDLVLSTSISPDYEVYAPNGSDCEPICQIAQTELLLP